MVFEKGDIKIWTSKLFISVNMKSASTSLSSIMSMIRLDKEVSKGIATIRKGKYRN